MSVRMDEALVTRIGEWLLTPKHAQLTDTLTALEEECHRQENLSDGGKVHGHLILSLENTTKALRLQALLEQGAHFIARIEILRETGLDEKEILVSIRTEAEEISREKTRNIDVFAKSFLELKDVSTRASMLGVFVGQHNTYEGELAALRFVLQSVEGLLNPKKGW